ncbi:hypothetical protein B0T13DRAFT_508018 [Neurospora crassa]|nr:hypothetical protein B0T13DRAFT_508018 [Neurospora crassa]
MFYVRYSILKTCIGFIGVNVGMCLMHFVMGRQVLMMTGVMVQGMFMLGMAISATTTEAGFWAICCLPDAIRKVRRRRGEDGEDGGKAATVEIVEEREKEV